MEESIEHYQKLGLKCGIEIHQQLEGQKLFCSCPTMLRDDQPHFTLIRKLRASAGELGEIDIAAQQEQQRDKTFVYEGYTDTTCLVEVDEEPPHALNQDALYTALQFSQLVKASTIPIIQVMRKTIVDGSTTSGFQRTALIAQKGKIETENGSIRIANISLEEDAAKIVSEVSDRKTYRLDRLGIPLIEVGTEPDIKTPQQCQEAAKKIGFLLRSLPGIKRGLGTIRQDINVSIAGGVRIEIKGAQDLRQLPLLVEFEVKRQKELLKIKEELKGLTLEGCKLINATFLFQNSTSKIIQANIKNEGVILALKLKNMAGFIGRELQPGVRVGTEFATRAKVIARVEGIFHSDELPNYGITSDDLEKINRLLGCGKNDAFILVADAEPKAKKALQAVYQRAKEAMQGIPQEVRKANSDGTTSYMRPLAGAARMYPETDVPLIQTDLSNISLPELLEEKIERFQRKLGLSKDLAEFIAKSENVILFEELVQQYPQQKPAFIAETLTSMLLEIKRNYGLNPDALTDGNFRSLFTYLAKDKIHKDIVLDVLIDMIKGQFQLEKYASLSTEEVHKVIKEIVEKNKSAPFSALMGMCMKELNGKASGKVISEMLRKIIEQGHK